MQASESRLFVECRALLTEDLHKLIPELSLRVTDSQGMPTQGYGYYSWKSRVAKIALNGGFGKVDGIALVDAGCEFFVSPSSLLKLNSYFLRAIEQGVAAFAISTPESQFTKRSLFDYFPMLSPEEKSPQFQSGILFISGDRGLEIVNRWDDLVWADIRNVDNTIGAENVDFYAHRHDQSVLSLILKSFQVQAIPENPPGYVTGLRNAVRAYPFPIWWSRNRTGTSLIPTYLHYFGRLASRFSLFYRLLFK